jgi:hypothetical protein
VSANSLVLTHVGDPVEDTLVVDPLPFPTQTNATSRFPAATLLPNVLATVVAEAALTTMAGAWTRTMAIGRA